MTQKELTIGQIKSRLAEISADLCGVVSDDAGNGCAGPSYLDSTTIHAMLKAGEFDSAVMIKLDSKRREQSFNAIDGVGYDDNTDWYQIEWYYDNGYSMTAWLW